ncbi:MULTISPECIES: DUF6843 domain-containing protein [Aquimarina]|uniref:DUF6843 domain-containing protein n=1 Tax=Aquimarina TaxID=290174 RepID=UPI000D5514D7|nr:MULTISPECIES: hypothetical protein [Aquimarina]
MNTIKKNWSIGLLSIIINIISCCTVLWIILLFTGQKENLDIGKAIQMLVIRILPLATGIAFSAKLILSFLNNKKIILVIIFIITISVLLAIVWGYIAFLSTLLFAIGYGVYNSTVLPGMIIIYFIAILLQFSFLHLFLLQNNERTNNGVLGLVLLPVYTIGFTAISIFITFGITMYPLLFHKETYLIPQNFQGCVRVVYNFECGVEAQKKNGRSIIHVPDNGLILLKNELKLPKNLLVTIWKQQLDQEFYIVDSKGNKEKLHHKERYSQNTSKGVRITGIDERGEPGDSNFLLFKRFYVYNGSSIKNELDCSTVEDNLFNELEKCQSK